MMILVLLVCNDTIQEMLEHLCTWNGLHEGVSVGQQEDKHPENHILAL